MSSIKIEMTETLTYFKMKERKKQNNEMIA